MSVGLTVRRRAKEDGGAFKAFLSPPFCLMEPEPPYYHEAKEGEIALFSFFSLAFPPWLPFFGFF